MTYKQVVTDVANLYSEGYLSEHAMMYVAQIIAGRFSYPHTTVIDGINYLIEASKQADHSDSEYNCDRCGQYTPNGDGMYLEETMDGEGTDDRVCGECYDLHIESMERVNV